jgi:hypothetical protein
LFAQLPRRGYLRQAIIAARIDQAIDPRLDVFGRNILN